MVIGYGMITKGGMVDMLPYKSPVDNKSTGTGWVNKIDQCKNLFTTMSMKLDVGGFLYQNITLEEVTKIDILNRIYSELQKNRKFCDNIINKDTKKNVYTDNGVHAKIEPKLQKMSKIKVLSIFIHEGVQKNIQGSFVDFKINFIGSLLIRSIVRNIGWRWK